MRVETARLVLRRWEHDHVDALLALVTHPDVARWLPYGTREDVVAAIDDAFDRVGLERSVAWTTPDNAASWRVMERCGMRRGGSALWKAREHVWYDVRRAEAR